MSNVEEVANALFTNVVNELEEITKIARQGVKSNNVIYAPDGSGQIFVPAGPKQGGPQK